MFKIKTIEKTYYYFLTTIFSIANPFKKSIVKTECLVHKYINYRALKILYNDKFYTQYDFYSSYMDFINRGAVWADQNFKSSNHFYHPYKKKGLYGRKNAMDLGVDYYYKAVRYWNENDKEKSMFFLGAALHIIQDMTIPQHANIRLLDNHHQYEKFVKKTYQVVKDYDAVGGAYLLEGIENFIKLNAKTALSIHRKFKKIKDDNIRFHKITQCSLPLAKRTTAGAFVLFYNHVVEKNLHIR